MVRPAIHPGEILADELQALGLSATAFASELHVPTNWITQILKGQRSITAETAVRLGQWFDMDPRFWLNVQMQYELRLAEQQHGSEIRREVRRRQDQGELVDVA